MKNRRVIVFASTILIVLIGFQLRDAGSSSQAALVFKGYERSRTNAVQFAVLDFQNTSKKPIWLLYSGREFPLETPFVARLVGIFPKDTNDAGTNVYSVSAGSFFMTGEKVLPGGNLIVKMPLAAGILPEQIGIAYYVGNFTNDDDFLSNLTIPLLDGRASFRDKIKFYWDKFRRQSRRAKLHEVWCPKVLSFQTEILTNSAK